jgi:hypothetical protein
MRVLHVLNHLGIGGTEKAAMLWAAGAARAGHDVSVIGLSGGVGDERLAQWNIDCRVVDAQPAAVRAVIREVSPDVVHAHVPGSPHIGDVLGEAVAPLASRPGIVSTNVFGRLDNPAEDGWTDIRVFISRTSGVQAATRHGNPLDEGFFTRQTIVSYPLLPDDASAGAPGVIAEDLRGEAAARRSEWGVADDSFVIGRFGRPDPAKWSRAGLVAILDAVRCRPDVWVVLQQVPADLWVDIAGQGVRDRVIQLPATADPVALTVTQLACDAIAHSSVIGESFGYAVVEPMALGIPVVTSSTPWADQAQLEFVEDGVTGRVASSRRTTQRALRELAADPMLRARLGREGRLRVERIAGFDSSVRDLLQTYGDAIDRRPSSRCGEDLRACVQAAEALDTSQWGRTTADRVALRATSVRRWVGRQRRRL